MIKLDFAKNKTYLVIGLGKSNRAVIKALKKVDADIRLWDDNPDLLTNYDDKMICPMEKAPWSKIKAVIVAPGIAPHHPYIALAREKDIPVICDIDLFSQSQPKSKIIGVTGTNGKSTVTALIHHVLSAHGKSQMGGNIGTPVLDLKQNMDFTVLELSSYQLEYAPHLKCDVAVLLNITPDHLDWHGDMDHYIASKGKIFDQAGVKIISIDDAHSKSIFEAQTVATPISIYGDNVPVTQSDFPKLKGTHNFQNSLAAYYVCSSLGIAHDEIVSAIKTFEGLAHRQYLARILNGISYINDSKATNAEAARHALRAYKNIFWILGGVAKDGGLDGLDSDLENVQKVYLYGQSATDFASYFKSRGIAFLTFDNLDEALLAAHADAQDNRGEPSGAPTVLLSPACASFDQFENFETRGDYFCDLVEALESE